MSDTQLPETNEVFDLIVVGAGIAGLIAARDVAKLGANVIVLEARDRIGGQIFSWKHPDTEDEIQFGAEWYNEFAHTSLMREFHRYFLLNNGENASTKTFQQEYMIRNRTEIIPSADLRHKFRSDPRYMNAINSINRDISVINYSNGYHQEEMEHFDIPVLQYFEQLHHTSQPLYPRQPMFLKVHESLEKQVDESMKLSGPLLDFFLSRAYLLCGGDPTQHSALALLTVIAALHSAERAFDMGDSNLYYSSPSSKLQGSVHTIPAECDYITGHNSGYSTFFPPIHADMSLKKDLKQPVYQNALMSCNNLMSRLVEEVADDFMSCGGRIYLNSIVTTVTEEVTSQVQPKVPKYDYPQPAKLSRRIRVKLINGLELVARGVIIALPLTCIPSLRYSPALPAPIMHGAAVCNAGTDYIKVWAFVSGVSHRIDRVLSADGDLKDCYVVQRHRYNLKQLHQRAVGARSPSGKRRNARMLSPVGNKPKSSEGGVNRLSATYSPVSQLLRADPPRTSSSRRRMRRDKSKNARDNNQASDLESPAKTVDGFNHFFNFPSSSRLSSPHGNSRPASPSSGMSVEVKGVGKKTMRSSKAHGRYMGRHMRGSFVRKEAGSARMRADDVGALTLMTTSQKLRENDVPPEQPEASRLEEIVKSTSLVQVIHTPQSKEYNNSPSHDKQNGALGWSDMFDVSDRFDDQTSCSPSLRSPALPSAGKKEYAMMCGVGSRNDILSHIQNCFMAIHPNVHFMKPYLSLTIDYSNSWDRSRFGTLPHVTNNMITYHAQKNSTLIKDKEVPVKTNTSTEDLGHSIMYHDFVADPYTRGSWFALRAGTAQLQAMACNAATMPWQPEVSSDPCNYSLMLIGSELNMEWTGWVEGGIRSGSAAAKIMHKYLYPSKIERNFVKRKKQYF